MPGLMPGLLGGASSRNRDIFDPAHEPVVWSQTERARGQAWGMQTVASFHIKGSPSVPEEEALLAGAAH